MPNLIFVDCEAYGGAPSVGQLTEFGAVDYKSRQTFHGIIVKTRPDPKNPAIPVPIDSTAKATVLKKEETVFKNFEKWLYQVCQNERPIFVSDNNGFDWQWINDGFWRYLGYNPFGHSSRRISDFWAGLHKDFNNTQRWKGLRQTVHDHNPVNDAMGNVEAFAIIMERIEQGIY